ncbi:MAG TPA: acyl-CoA dehydrogenase family protein [Xanthobacteraceae bacterium]|nr:acyl-CoA dehydrogenase family protein [Xanthobacteraceae bacterium]
MPGSPDPVPSEDFNQAPPLGDVDLFAIDRPLQEAVTANGAGAEAPALSSFGRLWGKAELIEQARLADENPPRLDAGVVEFHGAYHRFMTDSMAAGLHAMTWRPNATAAPAPAEVARAARYFMVAQVENGHMCPITMTRASVAALAGEPAVAAMVMPKITSRSYDRSFRPWWEKSAMTLGMGMTERQGGTDLRTNRTRAVADGDGYRITGEKWFMSAPMSDAFLVLAQAPGGLTCFFMPRFSPDGGANALHFRKLKDKTGNRSNASTEVEFSNAYALRVGEEGKGIRTILKMVQLTRLDCAIASAGLMRAALVQALHNARHRRVFGKLLLEQPMMRSVLADLALEVEGAVALVMRLCRAFDLAASDESEARLARLLTPAVKYWICKAAPAFAYEAMECLGGNGYVEESSILPRLFREAPVNAIWEGSGNVMCLDVLRALRSEGEGAQAALGGLAREAAGLPHAGAAVQLIERTLAGNNAEAQARAAVERLALLAASAALHVTAPDIAAVFARTRLAGRRGASFGTSDLSDDEVGLLLKRALPG